MSLCRFFSIIAFCALLFIPSMAFTNAAAPAEYQAGVDGNTVEVCPSDNMPPRCGTGDILLRQDLDSGEVVALDSEDCTDQELACGETGPCCFGDIEECCFQDPCVEAGTYRYGFSEPVECSACAWTNDFIEVVVDDEPTECEPTNHQSWDGDVPWELNPNGNAENGDGGDKDDEEQESGCNSTVTSVTLINLVVFALGLLLWRRRRNPVTP